MHAVNTRIRPTLQGQILSCSMVSLATYSSDGVSMSCMKSASTMLVAMLVMSVHDAQVKDSLLLVLIALQFHRYIHRCIMQRIVYTAGRRLM